MEKNTLYSKALNLLARREHSRQELKIKLQRYTKDSEIIHDVLDELAEQNYLSEHRFAEMFVRSKVQQHYGPERIHSELKQKGLSDEAIRMALHEAEVDWITLGLQLRQRKFGDGITNDFKELMKQKRYLQYRGYTIEQINSIFK